MLSPRMMASRAGVPGRDGGEPQAERELWRVLVEEPLGLFDALRLGPVRQRYRLVDERGNGGPVLLTPDGLAQETPEDRGGPARDVVETVAVDVELDPAPVLVDDVVRLGIARVAQSLQDLIRELHVRLRSASSPT